jgi:nitrite reductase/ring-hydroxylating ferredoxin subunit
MRIEDPDSISKSPDGKPDAEQPVWREQFPIDWPTDDFRSRRDFTKLLGLTSLAFVVGQAWIAFLALRRRTPPVLAQEVATVQELPVGGSKVFEYPRPGAACVLTRVGPDRFVAYGQKCTHLSCPVIPRPERSCLECPCHDGIFDLATGQPLSGPPRRPLPRLKLEVRDGRVFAAGVEEGVL